jgi:hypothetical protein
MMYRLVASEYTFPPVNVTERLMVNGVCKVKVPAVAKFNLLMVVPATGPSKFWAVWPSITTVPVPSPKETGVVLPMVEILPLKELLPL